MSLGGTLISKVMLFLMLFVSSVSLASIDSILQEQKVRLLSEKQQNRWHYPMYMGYHYTSQVWLVSNWLGMVSPKWDTERFKKLLLKSQLPDGSWQTLKEPANPTGDINPTILNYWALKSMGVSSTTLPMLKARAYVLNHGGAEKAHKFTQVFLMAFGNQPWNEFPSIPKIPFLDFGDLVTPKVARWIGPHIDPMIYLVQRNVVKDLGPNFKIGELFLRDHSLPSQSIGKFNLLESDFDVARKMFWRQRPNGSWGGSTSSTMFTQMALLHASEAFPEKRQMFLSSIKLGQTFNERMVLGSRESAYLGVTVDGRYWDTALVGQTLAELGVPGEQLASSAKYLLNYRDKTGGYGFGIDFEMDMDTDDTAEILLFHHKIGFYGDHNQQSLHWLDKMQNDDGGWGAFDKNNVGNWFMNRQTKVLEDTADFFDESSADVTGHILEALAAFNQTVENSESVRKAISYLRSTQEKPGRWYGRWGVNYIYGTSAAVVGLRKAGLSKYDPMLVNADLWIKSCQNSDGGFGEAYLTYKHPSLECKGISTPSQTAWALLALLETNPWHHPAVTKAVEYLTKNFKSGYGWSDESINGTGQPVTAPMQYPVYPKVFPTLALARFRNLQVKGY